MPSAGGEPQGVAALSGRDIQAVPGGRSWVSCSTQMFGAADQTSSLSAYRWFHAVLFLLSMSYSLWWTGADDGGALDLRRRYQ